MYKCDFKDCKCKTSKREIIQYGKKKYHTNCALKQIALWYHTYYNEHESWATMIKLITQWETVYGMEYMLYTMTQALYNKLSIPYFRMLRELVFNNNNYRAMFEAYKHPTEMMMFENVILTVFEYNELMNKLGNLKKVEYYIKKLNDYILKTGKVYSSHYNTILDWHERNLEKELITYKQPIL